MKTKNIPIRRNRLLTIIFLLFSHIAISQTWENLGELSVGGTEISFINMIQGYDSGLYLCSDLGLFRTTNTGASFTNLTYENGITTGERIYSIFFDSLEDVLYVGGTSGIYKSTNNGASWIETGVTGTQIINGIARSNGMLIASYGDSFGSGGVYYSTNGFDTYAESTGLPDLRMMGFYTQDNLLFLAGEACVYGSIDNGISWGLQGTGHENVVTGIKFIKNNDKIFVADRDGSGLYETIDSGATWTESDPMTFHGFCQIFDMTSSNGHLYVVTDGVDCNEMTAPIKMSSDNGISWSSGMFNLDQAYYAVLGTTVEGCVFTYAPFENKVYKLCDVPLQIVEHSLEDSKVYPNPSTGIVTLDTKASGTWELFNVMGQRVKKGTLHPPSTQIDIEQYPTGLYFLQVAYNAGLQRIKMLKK